MTTQEQKIKSAITDLIDNVERFFGVAPLQFLDIDGGNADIGCFTFLREHPTHFGLFGLFENWFQYLLETLDPFTRDDQEKAKAAEAVIEAVLPEDDKVKRAWCELIDSLQRLVYPAQRIGFYVGVFIGAKIQGASRDDLVEIGKGLVMPCPGAMESCARNRGIRRQATSQGRGGGEEMKSQKKIDKAGKALATVIRR